MQLLSPDTVILSLFSLISRPKEYTFLPFMRLNASYLSTLIDARTFHDYYLFTLVTVEPPIYSSSTYLGAFGCWFDVTTVKSTIIPSNITIPSCLTACYRGVCSPFDGHCICLPSWGSEDCSIPITGFQSVWSIMEGAIDRIRYVSPDLGRVFDVYTRTDFIAGVLPVYLFPASMRSLIPPLFVYPPISLTTRSTWETG